MKGRNIRKTVILIIGVNNSGRILRKNKQLCRHKQTLPAMVYLAVINGLNMAIIVTLYGGYICNLISHWSNHIH